MHFSRFAIKGLVLLAVFAVTAALVTYGVIGLAGRMQAPVVIPDLKGKNAVDAVVLVSGLGLSAKVTSLEFNSQFPRDHVLAQDPAPGQTVKKNRSVRLILSKGPKMVKLADLTAKPLQNAQVALNRMGLCLSAVSRAFSQTIAPAVSFPSSPCPARPWKRGHAWICWSARANGRFFIACRACWGLP